MGWGESDGMYDLKDTIRTVREQPPVYRLETQAGAILDVVHHDHLRRAGHTLQARVCAAGAAVAPQWLYAAQGVPISAAPSIISCGGLLFQLPPAAALPAEDNGAGAAVAVLAGWVGPADVTI